MGRGVSVPSPNDVNGKALAVFRRGVQLVEIGGMIGAIDVVVLLGPVSRVYVSLADRTVHIDIPLREASPLGPPVRQVTFALPADAVRVFATA